MMAAGLLEALEEHLDAISERDIDRFSETLARDETRFVGGDGRIIEGKENIVAAHRSWFMADGWTFAPEIVWVREESGAGWALTHVQYTENGSPRAFNLLLLFVQEDGAWKLVYDQNTPIT